MQCESARLILFTLTMLSLSYAGCAGNSVEPRATSDSVICDPATRTDCMWVTEGFVYGRLDDLSLTIRLKQELKACRARGP